LTRLLHAANSQTKAAARGASVCLQFGQTGREPGSDGLYLVKQSGERLLSGDALRCACWLFANALI
jgi:hypothetical protein